MSINLDTAVSVLTRTPRVLDTWMRDLPADWTHRSEGPGTWSPFDVVGHLIHGDETDWIPRARIILECGELRAFEPFDRFAQLERSKGHALPDLLDSFAALRARNLETLRGFRLTDADLARRGRHPELGAVTLGQLLATWTVHDLGHIRQIARAMAKQYADAVGPWIAYLSILRE